METFGLAVAVRTFGVSTPNRGGQVDFISLYQISLYSNPLEPP